MAITKVYISEVPPIVLRNPGKDGTSGTSGTSGVSGTNGTSGGSIAPNFSSAPESPVSGSIYFDTTDSHFYGWDGGQWKQLDN